MQRFTIHRSGIARGIIVALCTAMLAVACSSDPVAVISVVPGTLTSIVVTPNVTLAIRATQQFTAVGKDAAGVPVTIVPTWSVTGGGGTISNAGLFTAGTTPGTYTSTVQATSGGISGSASVVVMNGAVASVTRVMSTTTLP